MSVNENNRNGRQSIPIHLEDFPESAISAAPAQVTEPNYGESRKEPLRVSDPGVATRADIKPGEGMNKNKLVLLGGGLAAAVLFFVFTAVLGKPAKRQLPGKQSGLQAEQAKQHQTKGSLTPLMQAVRTPAPDNTVGQLGPNDIERTRSKDEATALQSNAKFLPSAAGAKEPTSGSLETVPSFSDTQQKWEEPRPYGETPASAESQSQQQQQNTLKEPSLVFVRSRVQNQVAEAVKSNSNSDGAPLLEITPGTRIEAKLETQISSAVQAPVVAVVEYTYAIGDRIVVPAGARIYGQLQQADRSGLIGVKFDEIELLDGAREKIDAIGTGLDLGPIKGDVYGTNTGKNFLVRAASGLGSVLAEIAGNNSSAAFSEDDMLRERVAENIGTAGDSEVMNLNANSRVVVSVPADTKIYIVFTKHEASPSELHNIASASK